jgi:hypothetical protein
MKHLNFFKSLMLIAIAFTVGVLGGSAYGFSAVASGVTTVVAFAVASRPAHVLSDGLDLTEVLADVKNYFRAFGNSIWVQIQKGTDFEQYMRAIPNQKGTYVSTASTRTEYLQPWQKGFTPSGGVALKPYETAVRRIKLDVLLDNLDELFNTYLAEMLVDETKTPMNYPFVKWLVQYHIVPGITEELRAMSVKGVYDAPTAPTPGASIDSADGIFTLITNEIAATNLTNIITTGAITDANIVDKVELFHKDLPDEYKGSSDPIFCSMDNVQRYMYTYRDDKGVNMDFNGPTVQLWGTNKKLVGLSDLNGSDRFLFTPSGTKGNLLKLYDKLLMPNLQFQEFNRDIKIMGDMHRSWGFETLDAVFVNDQA